MDTAAEIPIKAPATHFAEKTPDTTLEQIVKHYKQFQKPQLRALCEKDGIHVNASATRDQMIRPLLKKLFDSRWTKDELRVWAKSTPKSANKDTLIEAVLQSIPNLSTRKRSQEDKGEEKPEKKPKTQKNSQKELSAILNDLPQCKSLEELDTVKKEKQAKIGKLQQTLTKEIDEWLKSEIENIAKNNQSASSRFDELNKMKQEKEKQLVDAVASVQEKLEVWYKNEVPKVQKYELQRQIEVVESSIKLAEEDLRAFKRRKAELEEKLAKLN